MPIGFRGRDVERKRERGRRRRERNPEVKKFGNLEREREEGGKGGAEGLGSVSNLGEREGGVG